MVYLFDLSGAPVYFGGDEAHFAVIGHALAKTGRNLHGDLLPVFVNLADPLGEPPLRWGDTYYHPYLFYLEAALLSVVPLSITAARVPMALIAGVVSPLMLFAVARRLIGRRWPALIAALVLALAPMQVILGRQALDYVLPIPFVLAWLWFLDRSTESREPRHAALAGLMLGIGCYSYIASWAVMPALLGLSWLVWWRDDRGWRLRIASLGAFVLPLIVAGLWLMFHPEMLRDTLARYGTPPDVPKTPFVPTLLSLVKPALWFVRGGPSLTTATARSGVVLLPVAAFLAAGALYLARRRDWRAMVIAAGIVISILPAAAKGEPGMIQRAAYALPFIALAAGFGFAWLWEQRPGRYVSVVLAIASVAQFGYFYYDFFNHYARRSAFYYDPVAFGDVAARIIPLSAPAYFFTGTLDDSSVKWRFYTTADGRTDLLARTHYIGRDEVPPAAPGSVLVTYDETERLNALQAAGWTIDQKVFDVDQRPAAVILRKQR